MLNIWIQATYMYIIYTYLHIYIYKYIHICKWRNTKNTEVCSVASKQSKAVADGFCPLRTHQRLWGMHPFYDQNRRNKKLLLIAYSRTLNYFYEFNV